MGDGWCYDAFGVDLLNSNIPLTFPQTLGYTGRFLYGLDPEELANTWQV